MEDRDHDHHEGTRRGGLVAWRLERVTDYIDANLTGDLALDALAKSVALSTFHFARAFKITTGESPHAYVVGRRVRAAKQLLRESDLPLAEVARRCGFKTQSHFTGVFRKRVGLTPKVYRGERMAAQPAPEVPRGEQRV